MAEKVGALGQLYGDIIKAPFKLANLPFKSHREYFGKPKDSDKYTGSFLQKQRLKKLINSIFSGKNLSDNDRLFMDMFNDFITGEGRNPVDQSEVVMECDDKFDCTPYTYKSTYRGKKYVSPEDSDDETEEDDENTDPLMGKINIKFLEELKPKNSSKPYKSSNTYGFNVFKKNVVGGVTEIYVIQTFLPKDDYLIFKTPVPTIINKPIKYRVFQNNMKKPLRMPIDLGSVSAKIIV